jgi:von Willebrand factor A domain-containing protein 7
MRKKLFFSPKIGGLFTSALLMLAIGTLPAHGFCPSNGWRCAGEISGITHEDITRQAVRTIDAEFFGKPDLTMGMKHALDVIVEADAKVDKDQKTASKHFDGESFLTGKGRILNLSDAIVRGLQND